MAALTMVADEPGDLAIEFGRPGQWFDGHGMVLRWALGSPGWTRLLPVSHLLSYYNAKEVYR